MNNRTDWANPNNWVNMNAFADLARMPWSWLASGMDWMYRAALPPQFCGREASSADTSGSGSSASSSSETGSSYSSGATFTAGSSGSMCDTGRELSGDDLKLVRYKILFTKWGRERVLESGEDLISYSTTTESFAGVKIAKYLQGGGSELAEDDHRYIKFHMEVVCRYPKDSDVYERRRLDLLEKEVNIMERSGTERRAA